jgi:hypothetical protein
MQLITTVASDPLCISLFLGVLCMCVLVGCWRLVVSVSVFFFFDVFSFRYAKTVATLLFSPSMQEANVHKSLCSDRAFLEDMQTNKQTKKKQEHK